jgi:tetratricopeptide (TPR) repeat protein
MKPKIFIGSSVEGLNIAYAVQQNLTHDAEITVWDQGVFELSKTTIESLMKILDSVDFGIFVFSPDDLSSIRDKETLTIRDNVLFEFGLFVGKLNRERVFFVIPDKTDFHIPTDLIGITPGKYEQNREDNSYQAATGPVCNQIRNQIKQLGRLKPEIEPQEATDETEKSEESTNDWFLDYINGDYEPAKAKLEQSIGNKSGDDMLIDKAWINYIDFQSNDNIYPKKLIEYALENPDSLALQRLVCRMLLWEDYTDLSLEILESAITNFDNESSLKILLSDCHKQNAETDKAISVLEDSDPHKNPEVSIALSSIFDEIGEETKAFEIIHSSYLNSPSNEKVMYKYSRLLDDHNRDKEALYLLDKLTRKDPSKMVYLGYFSNCCLSLELYDNAMSACRKGNELSNGKEAWLLHNVGNLLKNKGFYSEAIKWLNQGLELDSSSEYAHNRLASALKLKSEENEKLRELCKEGRKLLRNYSFSPEAEPEIETTDDVPF